MTSKEQEIEEMVGQLGDDEAGVEALIAFYGKIETIYAEATTPLEDAYPNTTSNSTNQR